MYSVMWSEHCSYKSARRCTCGSSGRSRRRPTRAARRHRARTPASSTSATGSPSRSRSSPTTTRRYVEPYQGAATGVGGIVRDILTMGARPVAVMDPLRFGTADAPDTRRVLPGVVAGIGGYGNCLGLPNIGGEVVFDPSYAGNPLVNALCVGVMRHDAIKLAKRRRAPATWSCSSAPRPAATASAASSVLRQRDLRRDSVPPSVRACRWATRSPRRSSSSAAWRSSPPTWSSASRTSAAPASRARPPRLAAAAPAACDVDLDRVPLRDPTLAPEEILMSESQERMCAVVDARPTSTRSSRSARKWDVTATVIGDRHRRPAGCRCAGTARPSSTSRPDRSPHDGPVYERPYARPPGRTPCRPTAPISSDRGRRRTARDPAADGRLAEPLRQRPGSPTQYDRYVLGNTVLAQPEDAGHDPARRGRPGAGSRSSTDGNGRFARLDPYAGAQLALAEAYRNVAATGARPAGGHQLPELRLARGPRRDVAVRRGRPRPRRRLPARSASRSPAAT